MLTASDARVQNIRGFAEAEFGAVLLAGSLVALTTPTFAKVHEQSRFS